MGGYAGEILRVDLTSEHIKSEELDMDIAEKFLGGRGLGVKILYDELEPKIDPLGNENEIIFATGPITGTNAPTAGRFCVSTKSPLTGTICNSMCGGHFGAELKYAGYDAVIIEGKSDRPVFLWIEDDKVEIQSAEGCWGLTTSETVESIRKEVGNARVASIGPGGENLAKFASIHNDDRAAARGGVGTVMGSKKIKAVAVRGTGDLVLENSKKFKELVKATRQDLSVNPTTMISGAMNAMGTASALTFLYMNGVFPVHNYQKSVFKGYRKISGESMAKTIFKKKKACFGCPIACGRWIEVKDGVYSGTKGEGPEYETIALFGGSCGVDNLDAIAKANLLCNEVGLDTVSTGNTIGFAMECFEKGLINKDEVGMELAFGNDIEMVSMIEKIAKREGFGNLLAEGTKRAAEIIGKGSEDFAINVKGLELPGYDPRGIKGQALSYATSNRGGCHLRAWTALQETGIIQVPISIPDSNFDPKKIDRFSIKNKAVYVKTVQDWMATLDSIVFRIFRENSPNLKHDTGLISTATGFDFGEDEFMGVGDRIYTLERAFNAREGFSRKDDTLPKRFLKEPMPDGSSKGQVVELDGILDEFYELRGLDSEGHPTAEKMKAVGL